MNRPWRVIVTTSRWAMFGETVLGAYATREAAFTQAAARAVADPRAFRDATPTGCACPAHGETPRLDVPLAPGDILELVGGESA